MVLIGDSGIVPVRRPCSLCGCCLHRCCLIAGNSSATAAGA